MLQAGFSAVSLGPGFAGVGYEIYSRVPIWIWLLLGLWPFVILVVDIFVKTNFTKWDSERNQFMRLQFDTKLGMHSPVGPIHQTPQEF